MSYEVENIGTSFGSVVVENVNVLINDTKYADKMPRIVEPVAFDGKRCGDTIADLERCMSAMVSPYASWAICNRMWAIETEMRKKGYPPHYGHEDRADRYAAYILRMFVKLWAYAKENPDETWKIYYS